MSTATYTFPDLSEWQPDADFAGIRKQTDTVAVRAAYGVKPDKTMPARRDRLRAAGFAAIIYYLFLRSVESAVDQANETLALVGDLLPNEFLCVDYETEVEHLNRISRGKAPMTLTAEQASILPTVEQRNTVSSIFVAHSGRKTGIYMNASTAASHPVGLNEWLWIAAYQTNEPAIPHAAWQQTNNGGPWAGCGSCDTSLIHGSSQDFLKAMGNPKTGIAPCVGVQGTPDGAGYYQVGADGGVFCYGDARFYGSMGGQHLNAPIVGMDVTPTGNGYWLVGADYGLFTYGDAPFFGRFGG